MSEQLSRPQDSDVLEALLHREADVSTLPHVLELLALLAEGAARNDGLSAENCEGLQALLIPLAEQAMRTRNAWKEAIRAVGGTA